MNLLFHLKHFVLCPKKIRVKNRFQAPEQADPKYKETLLLYNEQNGAAEAVSDLKQSGNQYKVTTTQPLTANKPAMFYELRNSSAVAAFIKGFMSQENAKPFHFLRVAADKCPAKPTQSLLRLADNPKDPEGLTALCTIIASPRTDSKRSSSTLRI